METGVAENNVMTSRRKRDFRDAKTHLESQIFRNPWVLVTDLVTLLLCVLCYPLKYLLLALTKGAKSLRGKIVMVTGSGGALGREICKALASEGAVLVCADPDEKKNLETVGMLSELGSPARSYTLHVADRNDVVRTVEKVEAEVGPIFLLVNNASLCMDNTTLTEEGIRAMFDVNTLGPIWMMEALLKKMEEREEGHVANISSCSAIYGGPAIDIFGSTKAALTSYGQGMRVILSNRNIQNVHITNVHTGIIGTSDECGRRDLFTNSHKEVAEFIVQAVRYDKTECSTNTCFYIASNFARFLPVEVIRNCIEIFYNRVKISNGDVFNQDTSCNNFNLNTFIKK